MAKHRFQISLNDRAAERLSIEENKSQYIEGLILGENTPEVPWKDLEFRIEQLKDDMLVQFACLHLDAAETPKENRVVAVPVEVPECCTNTTSRCNHWQFNPLEDVWYNPNTGEERNI